MGLPRSKDALPYKLFMLHAGVIVFGCKLLRIHSSRFTCTNEMCGNTGEPAAVYFHVQLYELFSQIILNVHIIQCMNANE